MTKKNYTTKIVGKNTARAMLVNASISTKYSIEMSRELRGKSISSAEKYLNQVANMERYLPLRRFNKHVAHRAGIQGGVKSGRYPVNVSKGFLKLLNNLKSNADDLGLNSERLRIIHLCANYGRDYPRLQKTHNRIRRVMSKATNIEVIAREA